MFTIEQTIFIVLNHVIVTCFQKRCNMRVTRSQHNVNCLNKTSYLVLQVTNYSSPFLVELNSSEGFLAI